MLDGHLNYFTDPNPSPCTS